MNVSYYTISLSSLREKELTIGVLVLGYKQNQRSVLLFFFFCSSAPHILFLGPWSKERNDALVVKGTKTIR